VRCAARRSLLSLPRVRCCMSSSVLCTTKSLDSYAKRQPHCLGRQAP
jgi:hypothetical protein